MLIIIDIGNTHIVTAIMNKEGDIICQFRISTIKNLTEDEYFTYFKSYVDYFEIDIKDVQDIVLSSVVPRLNLIIDYFGKKYFNINPLKVGCCLNLPFSFDKKINSTGFGADRIVNITQALKDYPNKNLAVFDLGTATTYEVLKDNTYIGGGIFPGIQISLNALSGNTAKLPNISIAKPKSILGTDVVSAIQAGIFYGYVGQIKEIIRMIKDEIGEELIVVMTGGMGKYISSEIPEVIYKPDLGLQGIYSLYLANKR